MGFALREDLSFCVIDNHVVFLDVAHDRYFSIPEHMSEALISMASDSAQNSDARRLSALIDAGYLIETSAEKALALPQHALATADCDLRTYSAGDFIQAAIALLRTAVAMRIWPLRTLLRRVKSGNAKMGAGEHRDCGSTYAAALKGVGALAGTHERCLLYSLALTRLMQSAGGRPTLVFGVKLAPFAAHCWVQQGNRVINDTLEHVRLFTPIRVLS